MTGIEVAHAPHIAVTADPWPGAVAVYKSSGQDGFTGAATLENAAVIGETEGALARAGPGLWDRGPVLRVRLFGGALSAVTEADLLNGKNIAAIGSGLDDFWEVFQFRDAALVAPSTYELSMRLRGQLGTDALIPESWPAGSRFVLLNGALRQPDLTVSERGLERSWRIGPAQMPVEDSVFVAERRAFDGAGLRPYAPAHLRSVPDGMEGDLFTWIRRTRIDGDSWAGFDVPLGEGAESYLVRVIHNGVNVREIVVETPAWAYGAAERAADRITGSFAVEVAQISDRYGPGPFRRIEING